MDVNPHQRAVLAIAAAAREMADDAYVIVCELGQPSTTRERIRAWRKVRLRALTGLDRCVLAELLTGATWEEVADGYGLTPEEMQTRFEPTLIRWRKMVSLPADDGKAAEYSPGMPADCDPLGTAASLDLWARRHTEPWMDYPDQPVTQAICGQLPEH